MKGLNAAIITAKKTQLVKACEEVNTEGKETANSVKLALIHIYNQLVHSVSKHGYVVIGGTTNECIPDDKVIVINSKQNILYKIYALAHEAGHLLTLEKCSEEFGDRVVTGKKHFWPSLEAELRAWHTADKIMRRIRLYSPDYLKYKHACLRTYYRTLS